MDTLTEPKTEADIIQTLEEMRGELSLHRRALEGLTAARENIPDYSLTLGAMNQALKHALGQLDHIVKSPAISIPPDAMAGELIKAAAKARAEDARLLNEARDALSRSIGRIDGIVQRGQAADRQLYRQIYIGVAGLLAGILLWSVLPGAIARSLPANWHVPEWMAARILRIDSWIGSHPADRPTSVPADAPKLRR